MKVKWGAHLSKEGSFIGVLDTAKRLGSTAVQVFFHSPMTYFMPKGMNESAVAFGKEAEQAGITAVVHCSFFVNLASPKANIYAVSKKSIIEDLKLADAAGIPYVVTHIGSYTKGFTFEGGFQKVVEALNYIIRVAKPKKTMLLLETHAGGGTAMGGKIEEVIRMVKSACPEAQPFLGVCVDTAHSFAAGYDFNDLSVAGKLSNDPDFKQTVKVVHFNNPDLGVSLGSHLDRHRCTMQTGALTGCAMRNMFLSFHDKVLILERPNDDSKHPGEDLSSLEEDAVTLKRWASEFAGIICAEEFINNEPYDPAKAS